jgi:hypothetical protein
MALSGRNLFLTFLNLPDISFLLKNYMLAPLLKNKEKEVPTKEIPTIFLLF